MNINPPKVQHAVNTIIATATKYRGAVTFDDAANMLGQIYIDVELLIKEVQAQVIENVIEGAKESAW